MKINNEKVLIKRKVKDRIYRLTRKHLYVKDGGKYRSISAYVRPVANVVGPGGVQMKLRIRLETVSGGRTVADFKRSELIDVRGLVKSLLDEGFAVPEKQDIELIANFVSAYTPLKRIQQVERSGWHEVKHDGESSSWHFVQGRKVIGPDIKNFAIESLQDDQGTLARKGSVKQWRVNVGSKCRGNALLMTAVSHSFAAPLLRVVDAESDGIHFHGASTTGKTTAVKVAASPYGHHDTFKRSWNSTSNGIEAVAAQFSDLPLVLDELDEMAPADARKAFYQLGNGSGKQRAYTDGSARRLARFRNKILSTGNVSTEEYVTKAGLNFNEAQAIRIINILTNSANGMFDELHGYEDGAAFADALMVNISRYYGVVGDKFIRYVAEHFSRLRKELGQTIRAMTEWLMHENLDYDLTSAEQRVAGHLALTAWAGELATRLNLTGWKAGEAKKAVSAVLKIWLAARREQSVRQHQAILDQIRLALKSAKTSSFKRLDGERPASDTIYKHTLNDKKLYLIPPKHFRRVICKGLAPAQCKKALVDAGLLVADQGRTDKQVRIPNQDKKAPFIAIRRKIATGQGKV